MIISRKRFENEINKRVEEEISKAQERIWRDDREREMARNMSELEARLIAVEKKNGIDHPSHHSGKVSCYNCGARMDLEDKP